MLNIIDLDIQRTNSAKKDYLQIFQKLLSRIKDKKIRF